MKTIRLVPAAIISIGLSIGISLGTAIALADSAADAQFKSRVASLAYSDDYFHAPNRTVETGHKVCALLDQGIDHQSIENVIIAAYNDTRQYASYFAALFMQAAGNIYCPEHNGEFGNI